MTILLIVAIIIGLYIKKQHKLISQTRSERNNINSELAEIKNNVIGYIVKDRNYNLIVTNPKDSVVSKFILKDKMWEAGIKSRNTYRLQYS